MHILLGCFHSGAAWVRLTCLIQTQNVSPWWCCLFGVLTAQSNSGEYQTIDLKTGVFARFEMHFGSVSFQVIM